MSEKEEKLLKSQISEGLSSSVLEIMKEAHFDSSMKLTTIMYLLGDYIMNNVSEEHYKDFFKFITTSGLDLMKNYRREDIELKSYTGGEENGDIDIETHKKEK